MKYDSIKINGLEFVIHEDSSNHNDANDSLTNRTNYKFNAMTSFNGVNINFNFENSTTHFKKEDYFKTCLEILKTVKFSK